MARRTNGTYYIGTRNNQSTRKGGTKVSTNDRFNQEVNQRLYGNTQGVFGVNQKNLPRVAAAGVGNVPEGIRVATNAAGGRNKLETSPNGNMSAREYRYRAIRAAFGMSQG